MCLAMALRTRAVAICSVAAAALLWNCNMDSYTRRHHRPENGRGVNGAHWIQLIMPPLLVIDALPIMGTYVPCNGTEDTRGRNL